jgi:hypothetical protein
VVKGVPDGASVGPCSVAIAGERRQVEGDADHRQPIGLPVVKGVPDGARVGPRSVAIAGERFPGERDADHRQAIGLPWSRVCRMAPASGRAQSSPDQPVLRGLD